MWEIIFLWKRKKVFMKAEVKTKHEILFSENIREVFLYSDFNAYK